jgi:hypothetical protein
MALAVFLKPWQLRRVGYAQTDVEIDRLRRLAAAESELRRLTSSSSGEPFGPTDFPLLASTPKQGNVQKLEPTIDLDALERLVVSVNVSEALRREVNVATSILYAEEELRSEATLTPDAQQGVEVESDWIHRWKNGAAEVSTEHLQRLWGEVTCRRSEVARVVFSSNDRFHS